MKPENAAISAAEPVTMRRPIDRRPHARPAPKARDLVRAPSLAATTRPLIRSPRQALITARSLISLGHPTRAYDLVQETRLVFPNNDELVYLGALALARSGNATKAMTFSTDVLERVPRGLPLWTEAQSLIGRIHKDHYTRSRRKASRLRYANLSATAYDQAYRHSGDLYPAVNAATMALLAGRARRARRLARDVLDQALPTRGGAPSRLGYWRLSTIAEAYLVLGDVHLATDWYRRAVQRAGVRIGDIASMRRQVCLLQEKIPAANRVLDLLNPGAVVVFSGHKIDPPLYHERRKPTPRFPSDKRLEHRVARAIRKQLDELGTSVTYCSAANGADILCAEQVLQRGGELHIVLPFERSDFYRVSVDHDLGLLSSWRQRCDRVLAKATQIHHCTTEPYLGDTVLFDFANLFMQGLAIIEAQRLGVHPTAVAVFDGGSRHKRGGTACFLRSWAERDYPTRIIDLAPLRSAPPIVHHRKVIPKPATKSPKRKIKRRCQSMLFADVKNYSQIREDQSPAFLFGFLTKVARVLERSPAKPVLRNTWGDGLFLVFNHVVDCAAFALELLEKIESLDYKQLGLPEGTTVRIALHAGPVYRARNPITHRINFFGSHVTRAARIEPVTVPGCIFTSEQFAATLAAQPDHGFVCEFVGTEYLSKGYDQCPLYRLTRRWLR